MHLAQLNVARLRHPVDHPETAEFTSALEPINLLADLAPGFVWRLKGPEGQDDATEVRAGFECGIGLSDFQDLKPGDVIETYDEREIART